jgi:hypothetical protein
MKQFLPILFAGLTLFGCQKAAEKPETPTQNEAKKYDVTFKVADFGSTVGAFNASTKGTMAVGDTLKNYADNLYYYVFNSSGTLVKSITQSAATAGFGTVTDQLPTGTYDVFMAASRGALTLQASGGYNVAWYQAYPWNDTFTKTLSLTVGTSAITQTVRLDRAVGGLEITLTDVIPSTVAKISVVYDKDASNLLMRTGGTFTSGTATKDFMISSADVGVKNKKFFLYIGNTSTPAIVRILAYDASNNIISQKQVGPVTVSKNQITLLSGSLLLKSSSDFNVAVNPAWSTGNTQNF